MAYMNIPYQSDQGTALADFRFELVWKVHADDTYDVAKANGFDFPGIFITYEGLGTITIANA